MLKKMLTKEYIRVGCRANTWQEALKIAGNILVKNGNVTSEYVDAMIKVVNEFGPYIVLCKGVAFGHARPENGVLKAGISLAILEESVEFGHESNDPVKVVFAFAGKDHTSHIEMLQNIITLLENEESYNGLMNSKGELDVIKLLKTK